MNDWLIVVGIVFLLLGCLAVQRRKLRPVLLHCPGRVKNPCIALEALLVNPIVDVKLWEDIDTIHMPKDCN